MPMTSTVDDSFRQAVREENKQEHSRQTRINASAFNRYMEQADARPLLDRAREAAAWGVPDQESTGMSQVKLTALISELVQEIERLKRVR